MTLIHNERTKLFANALDRASTACVTVGVFAPMAAAFYNFSGSVIPLKIIVIGATAWILAALVLHLGARRVLKGLTP